jgi:hypothetical protein
MSTIMVRMRIQPVVSRRWKSRLELLIRGVKEALPRHQEAIQQLGMLGLERRVSDEVEGIADCERGLPIRRTYRVIPKANPKPHAVRPHTFSRVPQTAGDILAFTVETDLEDGSFRSHKVTGGVIEQTAKLFKILQGAFTVQLRREARPVVSKLLALTNLRRDGGYQRDDNRC